MVGLVGAVRDKLLLVKICLNLKHWNFQFPTVWDISTRPYVDKLTLCSFFHISYTNLRAHYYTPVTLPSTSDYLFSGIIFPTHITEMAICFSVSLLLSISRLLEPDPKYPNVRNSVLRSGFVFFFRLLVCFKWHDYRTFDKRAFGLVFVPSEYQSLFCF